MVIESIRQFNSAVPFQPYELHLAEGRVFTVPHPDLIAVSPKGSYLEVIDENERPWHINATLIASASPLSVSAN